MKTGNLTCITSYLNAKPSQPVSSASQNFMGINVKSLEILKFQANLITPWNTPALRKKFHPPRSNFKL